MSQRSIEISLTVTFNLSQFASGISVVPTTYPDASGDIALKQQRVAGYPGDFVVLFTKQFRNYKTARERERFLKSGQGRKWLDEVESGTQPASG